MIFLFILTTLIFWWIAWFLSKEHQKKFAFLARHIEQGGLTISWESPVVKSGMYTIALSSLPSNCMSILIGFDLKLPLLGPIGVDPFGQINTRDGKAAFSCYLTKSPVTFRFLTNIPISWDRVQIDCTPEDLTHRVVPSFPPHWWQRMQ